MICGHLKELRFHKMHFFYVCKRIIYGVLKILLNTPFYCCYLKFNKKLMKVLFEKKITKRKFKLNLI